MDLTSWDANWIKMVLDDIRYSVDTDKSHWEGVICKIAPRLTLTIPIMTEFNIADFKALVKRTRSKTSLLAGVAKEKLSTLALAWADKDAKVKLISSTWVRDLSQQGWAGWEEFHSGCRLADQSNELALVQGLSAGRVDRIQPWQSGGEGGRACQVGGRGEGALNCDKLQERSMKGNLIISSPATQQEKSCSPHPVPQPESWVFLGNPHGWSYDWQGQWPMPHWRQCVHQLPGFLGQRQVAEAGPRCQEGQVHPQVLHRPKWEWWSCCCKLKYKFNSRWGPSGWINWKYHFIKSTDILVVAYWNINQILGGAVWVNLLKMSIHRKQK